MIYRLDFRERNRGGRVVPGLLSDANGLQPGLVSEAALKRETAVAFLIHGYNNTRSVGIRKLLDLASLLPLASSGALVATLWPGDHWLRGASYPLEGRDADTTAVKLAAFITRVIPPETPLSFVTFSLGARVALECIRRLPVDQHPVAQVCLMAAAIDDDSLAAPKVYSAATEKSERVAVLSSRADKLLKSIYPVGDLFQAFLFARDTPGGALGFNGPQRHRKSGRPVPANVLRQPLNEDFGVDHDDYFPGKTITDKHRAAAQFADEVLAGKLRPHYL